MQIVSLQTKVSISFSLYYVPQENTTMERKFTLEYWIDDGWYVGRIKEVPGVFSQGETLEELEENIADAYKMVLEDIDEYVPSMQINKKEVSLNIWKENSSLEKL